MKLFFLTSGNERIPFEIIEPEYFDLEAIYKIKTDTDTERDRLAIDAENPYQKALIYKNDSEDGISGHLSDATAKWIETLLDRQALKAGL